MINVTTVRRGDILHYITYITIHTTLVFQVNVRVGGILDAIHYFFLWSAINLQPPSTTYHVPCSSLSSRLD